MMVRRLLLFWTSVRFMLRLGGFDDKPQIINRMRTTQGGENQAFLGVSPLYSEDKVAEGVRVNITRNSGAAKAGLKDDDVILQINKTPVRRKK